MVGILLLTSLKTAVQKILVGDVYEPQTIKLREIVSREGANLPAGIW